MYSSNLKSENGPEFGDPSHHGGRFGRHRRSLWVRAQVARFPQCLAVRPLVRPHSRGPPY